MPLPLEAPWIYQKSDYQQDDTILHRVCNQHRKPQQPNDGADKSKYERRAVQQRRGIQMNRISARITDTTKIFNKILIPIPPLCAFDSYWMPLVETLYMQHRPHDTRHTCISMLTVAGVDDKVIKKIVGHKGQSVTEVVYTHFEIEELLDAINRI